MKMKTIPEYEPRFVSKEQLTELINLWHLARTALAGDKDTSSHAREVWAARAFVKEHPDAGVSEMGAYKDLSAALEWRV